jgi:hypothetical protein
MRRERAALNRKGARDRRRQHAWAGEYRLWRWLAHDHLLRLLHHDGLPRLAASGQCKRDDADECRLHRDTAVTHGDVLQMKMMAPAVQAMASR